MKKLLIALCCVILFAVPAFSQGTTRVRGTVRKDGAYIPPHTRTSPNKTKLDNYSTKGNVNPHTGKKGTKNPY
jgi:hypothetical protein